MGDTSQRSACSPGCGVSSCAIAPRRRSGLTMLCAGAVTAAASARIRTYRIPLYLSH